MMIRREAERDMELVAVEREEKMVKDMVKKKRNGRGQEKEGRKGSHRGSFSS